MYDAMYVHIVLLTTNDTREILNLTWDYRASWKFIGIELGIDVGTLSAIDKDYRMVGECLREMIIHWLSNERPKPTQDAITTALRSEHVLAGNCHQMWLCDLLNIPTVPSLFI